MASPNIRNVFVYARRNGDILSPAVLCFGHDLDSVGPLMAFAEIM